MEIDFKFEVGDFVKPNPELKDPKTQKPVPIGADEKYKVMGRAYTEGLNGEVISADIIYYVSPVYEKIYVKRDKFGRSLEQPKIYTVKQRDIIAY